MPFHLPFAAGFDWLEGIVPLLVVLFWIASQVRNLVGGAGRGKAAGPVVARPAQRPPAADDERHRDLARQVEEFLRDAGVRGREARPAQPREVANNAERRRRREPESPRQPPRLPPPLPPRPPAGPPRTAAAVPALRNRTPSALGSLGGHATDVARHVEDAFAHEIEHLPSTPSLPGGVTKAGGNAVDIAAVLRDPATLRNLVIMREVLDRPVERW